MRYPGGKNAPGVAARIVNQMPPHDVYVELFGGSAAVLRAKRPAAESVVVEADPRQAAALRRWVARSVKVVCADALEWLPRQRWSGRVLIYADPPYYPDVLKSRSRYRVRLTRSEHARLLDCLAGSAGLVLLSGYRCALYDERLAAWRRVDYEVMTRGGGPVVESLWANFSEPPQLFDYSKLGANFRERERIKRKRERWRRRLAAMPVQERNCVRAALAEVDDGSW